MSPRRRPISPRAVAQLLAAAALLGAVAAALDLLHETLPTRDVRAIVEDIEPPDVAGFRPVTCQRILEDRPPAVVGERPSPVGRIRSAEVVACPDTFDPESRGGPPVVFLGEVVGDVLERDDGAWVLMNDDAYALVEGPLPASGVFAGTNSGLAVWLPYEVVAADDLVPGRPGRRGTVLVVHGRIHRTDLLDGGGLTLRAFDAEVVAPPVDIDPPFHDLQAVVAAVLATITAGAIAYDRVVRRRL